MKNVYRRKKQIIRSIIAMQTKMKRTNSIKEKDYMKKKDDQLYTIFMKVKNDYKQFGYEYTSEMIINAVLYKKIQTRLQELKRNKQEKDLVIVELLEVPQTAIYEYASSLPLLDEFALKQIDSETREMILAIVLYYLLLNWGQRLKQYPENEEIKLKIKSIVAKINQAFPFRKDFQRYLTENQNRHYIIAWAEKTEQERLEELERILYPYLTIKPEIKKKKRFMN